MRLLLLTTNEYGTFHWLARSSPVQRVSTDVVSDNAAFLDKTEPERVELARPEVRRVSGLIAETAEDYQEWKLAKAEQPDQANIGRDDVK